MNLLNINGYTSAVSHFEKMLSYFDSAICYKNKDTHSRVDINNYLYRCPILTSYFLVCGFQSKTHEFRGVECFDDLNVLKKVLPGAKFFIEDVLATSSTRNAASVEALHSFYKISEVTYSKLTEAIEALSSDKQKLISRDRLFIAATSLLLTYVFPKNVEMTKPLVKMTDFNQLNLRLSDALNVEHLLTNAPISNLYPQGLERRILRRVGSEVATLLKADPFKM